MVLSISAMEDSSEETCRPSAATPLLFSVEDKPSWILSLLLGLQHYLTTIGGIISVPFILAPALCIVSIDPAKGYLISTIFMVSGISTLFQCTLGIRLPIVQGSSFAFITCILTLSTLGKCPSTGELFAMGQEKRDEEWQSRMVEIQGAVITVGILETILGYTGIIGLLLRFISPLTIAPTITLVGLSMVEVAANMSSGNWYISLSTIALVILFSQILRSIHTPLPWYSFAKGWHIIWIFGFQLFSVLLTTTLVWTVCYILTVTNTLHFNDTGRTDQKMEAFEHAEWFRIPYPFQWGLPQFSLSSILAMLAALFVSIFESIGDYYACASICGKRPPPVNAISRGIGAEGLGCVVAGIFGIGPGVTSFSENIGAIGVTKVASRRVIICGAVSMIVLSIFGKFGAIFALIPTPVVGGLLCVMFSMVTAVGLSNLQFVDLTSHRNLFVLGSSLFFGVAIPEWMEAHGNLVKTGDETLDQLILVLFSTKIFVAAAISFILDNTLPGTLLERGILPWLRRDGPHTNDNIYELPSPNIFGQLFALACGR